MSKDMRLSCNAVFVSGGNTYPTIVCLGSLFGEIAKVSFSLGATVPVITTLVNHLRSSFPSIESIAAARGTSDSYEHTQRRSQC